MSRVCIFLCGGLLVGVLAFGVSAQTAPNNTVPRLIEELKSPCEKVRANAVASLGAMGPEAKAAAPALVEYAVSNRGHAATLRALTKIDDEATRTALRRLLVGGVRRCKCGNTFVDVVAEAGEPIVPHLLVLISERDHAENAGRVLVLIGTPAVPHVIGKLDHPDAAYRLAMYRSLGAMGTKASAAAAALEKRLTAEKDILKLHAAQSLFMVTGFHKNALDVLHDAARGDDKTQRSIAVQCLLYAGCKTTDLIPTMVAAVLAGDDREYAAASVLTNIGSDATPALLDALKNAEGAQSHRLLHALCRLGPNASAAVPAVIKLLEGADRKLALHAASSLPGFGPEAKQAIPSLLIALQSDDFAFRSTCAESLVYIDRNQIPQTVAPLVAVVKTGKPDEQFRSLWLLRGFGTQAKSAAPALVELLKTEKLTMRVSIAEALNIIDPAQIDAALPTLIEAIQAKADNTNSPRIALRLLSKLGAKAKSAVPTLQTALKDSLKSDGEPLDPYAVLDCLKRIDASAEFMPILIEALNSTDKNTRNEARYLITEAVGASALPALEAALANGQLRSSPEVVAAMKQLRSQPAGAGQ